MRSSQIQWNVCKEGRELKSEGSNLIADTPGKSYLLQCYYIFLVDELAIGSKTSVCRLILVSADAVLPYQKNKIPQRSKPSPGERYGFCRVGITLSQDQS